jgi:hypothetical protein
VLTVGAYRRAGGLPGLEAEFITRRAAGAERSSGFKTRWILKALLEMVDVAQKCTVPRSTEQLVQVLRIAGADDAALESKLELALQRLEETGVLRLKVVAADSGAASPAAADSRIPYWLLVHAYMWRGVVEASSAAEYWTLRATSERAAWLPRPSVFGLMSLRVQLALAAMRASRLVGRGTFRYGALRNYALFSTLKFLPIVAMLALALGLAWRDQLRDERAEAEKLWSALGEIKVTSVDRSQSRVLWEIAKRPRRFRLTVFETALATSERAARRPEVITQATVGLDAALRGQVIRELLVPRLKDPSTDPPTRFACLALGDALAAGRDSEPYRAACLEAIGSSAASADPVQLESLAQWFAALKPQAGAEDKVAMTLARRIVELTKTAHKPGDSTPHLEKTMDLVRVALDREGSAEIVNTILRSVPSGDFLRDAYLLKMAEQLGGASIDPAEVEAAGRRAAAWLPRPLGDNHNYYYNLFYRLSPHLVPDARRAILRDLVASIPKVADLESLHRQFQAIRALQGQGTPEGAVAVARKLAELMPDDTVRVGRKDKYGRDNDYSELIRFAKDHGATIDAAVKERASRALVAAIRGSNESEEASRFADAFDVIGGPAGPGQAETLANVLAEKIRNGSFYHDVDLYLSIAARWNLPHGPELQEAAFNRIVRLMDVPAFLFIDSRPVAALGRIGQNLSPEMSRRLACNNRSRQGWEPLRRNPFVSVWLPSRRKNGTLPDRYRHGADAYAPDRADGRAGRAGHRVSERDGGHRHHDAGRQAGVSYLRGVRGVRA